MTKNIFCLEGEWLLNSKPSSFNLKTESLLNWLREFHGCKVLYRNILSREDLAYYFDYLCSHARVRKQYDIVYISCHGWNHQLSLEGKNGDIDLTELAELAGNALQDKIVHFGCCKTLANESIALHFKEVTGARLVSGYTRSVDAMNSAVADIALFNQLMDLTNIGVIKNRQSKFYKTFASLLDSLGFVAF